MLKKLALLLFIFGASCAALGTLGCSYGGIAGHKGKIYIARNDMFLLGALRKVYVCTPQGNDLACSAAAGAP